MLSTVFKTSSSRLRSGYLTIQKHLNSKIHRGTNVSCPFCKNNFVSASGLSHHLETGSCPKASGMNRVTIHRALQQCDVNGLFTNKQIEWHQETHLHYQATDRAYNGYSWECYLCHRKFQLRSGLNQHINSPVHQQKVYHCPNRVRCKKEFVALAGLLNHLESESCEFMRFEKVQQTQKTLTDAIMGRKVITGF